MAKKKEAEAPKAEAEVQIGTTISIKELVTRITDPKSKGFYEFCDGGLKDSPKITDQQMLTAGIEKPALYLGYVDAFATDDVVKIYNFDVAGGKVFAVEELHKGQYAILREQNGIFDIAVPEDPDKNGLPIIALLALAVWGVTRRKASQKFLVGMSTKAGSMMTDTGEVTGNLDVLWKKKSIVWSLPDTAVNLQLLEIQKEFNAFIETEDKMGTKFRIRKISKPEEKMLSPHCEKSKYFKNAKNMEEFENACNEVALIFGQKKKRSFKEIITSLPKLMQPSEMVEEHKFLVHTWDEPRFENGFVFEMWHWYILHGIRNGIVRNLLLYGPAGSGKSTIGSLVSLAFGLPDWGNIVCSSEMNRGHFIGEHIVDSDGNIIWMPSALINCLRYGGIIEIQEIACIRDPGQLTVINNFLDPNGNGIIEIAETGERFQRHPASIVFMTTNQDYAGCRPVNISVVSRSDIVYYVPGLTEETLIARVGTEPKVVIPENVLKNMAKAFLQLIELAMQEGIYGDMSYRSFLAWCKQTSILGDPIEAAEITLIDKMAFVSEDDTKMKLRQVLQTMFQTNTKFVELDSAFEELRLYAATV